MVRQSFDELATLDKRVHEPARLAILTALTACRGAKFTYLQALTGLTQGNLSVHLKKLEEAGFVVLERGFEGNYRNTLVRITGPGRSAIDAHWKQLEALRRAAKHLNSRQLMVASPASAGR